MQITLLICPKCSEVSRLHPQDYIYTQVLEKELVLNTRSKCNGCQKKYRKGAKFLFARTNNGLIIEGSTGISVKWEKGTPVAVTLKGEQYEVNNRYLHVVTDSR